MKECVWEAVKPSSQLRFPTCLKQKYRNVWETVWSFVQKVKVDAVLGTMLHLLVPPSPSSFHYEVNTEK